MVVWSEMRTCRQLMPLPLTASCFSKIQIGFTFLVPAYRVDPDKGPLNGCVCVCVCVFVDTLCHMQLPALSLQMSGISWNSLAE